MGQTSTFHKSCNKELAGYSKLTITFLAFWAENITEFCGGSAATNQNFLQLWLT